MRQTLEVGDRSFVVRRAVEGDLPAIIAMLADDELGATRESSDVADYADAFAAIDAVPDAQFLAVLEDAGGEVVATMQLTLIPGLSRRGASRLQIEAVRVSSRLRGSGVGGAMFEWAHEYGRQNGAQFVQLTSEASRVDAHRFYERLGYVAGHVGFKRSLD